MFSKFEHVALRAFDAGYKVGDTLPNSFNWVDGECFEDEELDGACGLKISSEEELENALEAFRAMYVWDGRVIYVIGGDWASWGQDAGEIIIRNAKVLKVIGR